jgi:glycosyltransferase involved in cell wall biosynthesis
LHLTIIIPVYNEAGAITVTLERIRKTAMPCFVSQTELLIVDDCSTDGSAALVEKAAEGTTCIRLIRLPVNSGKGAAVTAGVKEAQGDTIIIQDADLELDPADIPLLLERMYRDNLDLVSGTRFAAAKQHPGHASAAIILNRLISAVAARLTGRKISDLTCGYKLIRKELFMNLNLREKRFGFETELMFKALLDTRIRFAEEPVTYSPRRKSEGKKIHFGDGLGIVAKLFRYGFAGKNWFSLLTIILLIASMTGVMLNEKHWKDERRVIEWDAISYYAYLPAAFIYNDLSLSFADNYRGPHKFIVWPDKGPEGRYVIKTSMGLSMLWSPFFLTGHAAAILTGADAGGYSPPYKFFLLVSALSFLATGLVYLRKILLLHSSDAITAAVLAAFVIGTNLYWYTLYQGTMPHVYSFALISAFIWYSIKWHSRGNKSAWPATRLGLLLGLITLIRPTNIVIVLILMLYGVLSADSLRQRFRGTIADYRLLAVIAIAAFAVWVPQLIYWKEMTGQWLYYSYGSNERFFFGDPAIIKGLFSWRKGLFIYTPLMVFAFAGIITLWMRRSPHALAVTLFVPVNIFIIFSWWCWWYGGGFGQRAFIDSYALMAVASSSLLSVAMVSGKKELKRILPAGMSAGRKMVRRLVPAAFIMLGSFGIFYNFQYYHGAIHWDSMTREAYFDSFGRTRPSAKFDELLEAPDYDRAREGLDR